MQTRKKVHSLPPADGVRTDAQAYKRLGVSYRADHRMAATGGSTQSVSDQGSGE